MDQEHYWNTLQQDQFLFTFEEAHNVTECQKWMSDNWGLAWYSVAVYVLFIYIGTLYMKHRPRYELRGVLVVWNASLAVFSILGTVRFSQHLIEDIYEKGLQFNLCDISRRFSKPDGFWGYLFVLSKVYELGDTVFIVLRKQQLIFLHYYHHITVLLYSWYFYPQKVATNRWFTVMNLFVHSFMYSYYMLRTMRVKLPRYVNITITCLQITQMIAGIAINIHHAMLLRAGSRCDASWLSVRWALAMYVSYFVLFAKFFYDAYIRPKPSSKRTVVKRSEISDKCNKYEYGDYMDNKRAFYSNGVQERNGFHISKVD